MKAAKFVLALVLGTWFLGSASAAQTPSFPERPIKMIVGFSAGGGTDVVARILAQKMSDTMGQSVVVENRTGASGLIAAEAVAKSPPDGYTIMMGSQTTLAVAPTLYRRTGLDPARDFAGIALAGVSPMDGPRLDCGAFGPRRDRDCHGRARCAQFRIGRPWHYPAYGRRAVLLAGRDQNDACGLPRRGAGHQ